MIISSEENWHCLIVAKLSALLNIILKHNGDFCCLNCLYSFRTEERRDSCEKIFKYNKYCKFVMSNKLYILISQKSIKVSFVIYVNFITILEKANVCDNNPEAPDSTKIYTHRACDFSIYVK